MRVKDNVTKNILFSNTKTVINSWLANPERFTPISGMGDDCPPAQLAPLEAAAAGKRVSAGRK